MTDSVYYNENNPFAVEWLENLIAAGELPDGAVDGRSIRDVGHLDLSKRLIAHFFAGIGGWPLALRLAGWPSDRPVWTGSCPCQPFSCAGRQKGEADERHLWPEFRRLIAECRPATIFGEQVASRDGREWLSRVRTDLEALGYAVGAADLCAAGQAAPHIRQRLYFVGHAESDRDKPNAVFGSDNEQQGSRPWWLRLARRPGATGPPGYASESGLQKWQREPRDDEQKVAATERAGWSSYRVIECLDGNSRRVSAQPGDEPLATRLPVKLGRGQPELARVARLARENRVGRLRGYGNAIVPQVAATFIRAFMESVNDQQ